MKAEIEFLPVEFKPEDAFVAERMARLTDYLNSMVGVPPEMLEHKPMGTREEIFLREGIL